MNENTCEKTHSLPEQLELSALLKSTSSENVSESDSGVNLVNSAIMSSAIPVKAIDESASGKQDDSLITDSPCSELDDPVTEDKDTASSDSHSRDPDPFSEDQDADVEDAEDSETPEADSFAALGLPPGWRRMTGDSGVYYWHVQSGEISRQIPEFQHSISHPEDPHKLLDPSSLDPSLIPESHSEGMLHVDDESLSLSHSSSQELSKLVECLDRSKNDMQSLVFPVFGLGSCTLDREDLKQNNSVAISSAIRYICQESGDVFDKFSGRDFLLVLENESLQVCDYLDNCVLLTVPVSNIRLWGVGKDSGHDFAFVSKDRASGIHNCYAFRSDRSAKAISVALQKLCDKIVAERAAKRRSLPANPFLQPSFENKYWNDNEPVAAANVTDVNEAKFSTPLDKLSQRPQVSSEECERFYVYYIGSMPSEKPSGIASINEAIADLRDIGEEDYTAAIVHVSPSSILITNESSGVLITESRVRYLSFLGIGKDACKFGYIVSTCRNQFICHVLHCPESAGPLAKSVESACKVRYQKVLEAKKRQLLAAPKLTRQQTLPSMMSALSKSFQDALLNSTSRQSTITDGSTQDDVTAEASQSNEAPTADQSQSSTSIRSSFSSLFGRFSRYTSSARATGQDTLKQRPKSHLFDESTIVNSFEYYDD